MQLDQVILATLKGNFSHLDDARNTYGDPNVFYLGIKTFGEVLIHCKAYNKSIDELNGHLHSFMGNNHEGSLVADFSSVVDFKNIAKNFETFLNHIDLKTFETIAPGSLQKILDIYKSDSFKELAPVLERVVLYALNPNEKKNKIKIV